MHEPYKVTFEDRPVPEIGDAHDVIVEVKFTGICGSDVSFFSVSFFFFFRGLGVWIVEGERREEGRRKMWWRGIGDREEIKIGTGDWSWRWRIAD